MKHNTIEIENLQDHPLNREFPRTGEKWEGLVASMRQHGQLTPLVVRPLPEGCWQVLAGHRRKAAAEVCGIEALSCVSREMTDQEALEFVVLENLEREEVDTCEEARLVEALVECWEGDKSAVAKRLCRSLEWVETRQGLLDLGGEVLAAVRRPREDEGHLSIATVKVLLGVPAAERERAVQLVLHPEFQMGVLSARAAAEVVREAIMDPLRRKLEWAEGAPKFVKAWRKRLGAAMSKAEAADLAVLACEWGLVEKNAPLVRSGRAAEDFLIGDAGKTWVQLAVRHGLTVWVVPDDSPEGSRAVVDEGLLRQAEAARAKHGMDVWLDAPERPQAPAPASGGLAKTGVENPEDILREMEERDSREPEEPEAETVIEQRMEHHAMIDMGAVKSLKAWAIATDSDPMKAPEWLPKWAKDLAMMGYWQEIDQVCNWVTSLKGGAK
jgi:ParB/RepB/Spo0J family partition protein